MTRAANATSAAWSQLRLRQSPHLRDLIAETTFTSAHRMAGSTGIAPDLTCYGKVIGGGGRWRRTRAGAH